MQRIGGLHVHDDESWSLRSTASAEVLLENTLIQEALTEIGWNRVLAHDPLPKN